MLRGNVSVQADITLARFQAAGVVWIEKNPGGGNRVTIYGEGTVHLENGIGKGDGASALIEFITPGEIRYNAHPGPVAQSSQANDPLVQRSLSQRGTPATVLLRFNQVRYQEKAAEPAAPEPRTQAMTTQILGPASPPPPPPPPSVAPIGAPPIVPGPTTPPPLVPPPTAAPAPALPPIIEAPARRFSVSPRSVGGFNLNRLPDEPDGRSTFVITGGAIINVRNAPNLGLVDVEADRIIIWTKGVRMDEQALNNMRTTEGEAGQEIEFYLSGNVEIRQAGLKDSRILRADEVYYDVNRNVAIAANAQLEFKLPAQFQITDPVVFRAEEVIQHSENQFELIQAEVFSSKLPSDPGLKVYVTQGTIENRVIPRLSPFGFSVLNRQTGDVDQERELYFRGQNVFFDLENIPFFYSPYLAGNLLNPLGPVEDISFGYNRIFGFDAGVTLNLYDLLGIQPYDGTKWRLHFDELGARGPGIGSTFDFGGKRAFGIPNTYEGTLTGYAIHDDGFDVLGGGRSGNYDPPIWRGRALWRENVYDLPYGFTVQSQISYLSDRNFLEQYFWREFALDVNQSTYGYVKQQQDFWAWTFLVEPRLHQPWMTVGEKLPEFTGRAIGVSLFDSFNYNLRASAAYAQLKPTDDPGSPPASAQDQRNNTGRLDLMQELSLPFMLGPFKVVPYVPARSGGIHGRFGRRQHRPGLGRRRRSRQHSVLAHLSRYSERSVQRQRHQSQNHVGRELSLRPTEREPHAIARDRSAQRRRHRPGAS